MFARTLFALLLAFPLLAAADCATNVNLRRCCGAASKVSDPKREGYASYSACRAPDIGLKGPLCKLITNGEILLCCDTISGTEASGCKEIR